MEKVSLSVFLVLFLGLLVVGCKRAGKGKFHEDFLELSVMKKVQGFAAMGVILHHTTQIVTEYGRYNRGLINVMVDGGVFFTALFFFCSGYGLVTSFLQKEDYLKGFLKKRLSSVLVPFYVCNLLFIIVSLIAGAKPKAWELVLYLSGIVMLNDQMWFIVELAVLYLLFYLLYRKCVPGKLPLRKMVLVLVVMTAVSLLLGHDGLPDSQGLWFFGEWWYNTTWTFFVGMAVAKYRDSVVDFTKRKYKLLLGIGVPVFVIMYAATMLMLGVAGYWKEWDGHPGYLEKFLTFCVQAPTVIVFVLLLFLISMKVQFGNKVLAFLSVAALEMYLLQNIFLTYLRPVLKVDVLYYVAVYVCTILLAVVVHKADRRIIRGITER